jgi:ribose transport system substrate-binding protein
MKQPAGLASALVFCSAIVGCGSQSQTSTSIAFVTGRPGSADPFMASLTIGAQSKAMALGVDLLVRPSPDWNPTAQTPIVDELIKEKAGAIVIQPTSTVTADMSAPLRQAYGAGIKIITVDTFIGQDTYGQGGPDDFPLAYIGSDNVEGGKIGCDGLAMAVGDIGKVLIVGGGNTVSSVVDREKGCRDELSMNHPGIVMVNPGGELQGSLTATEWAQQITIQYMASNPDLKGVFTVAHDIGLGATQAVNDANKQGSIRVVVFDCDTTDAAGIRAGTIYGCVAQKPALMGETGVEFAHDALSGVTNLPTYTSTGFVVLNQGNIDSPALAQFVYGAAL